MTVCVRGTDDDLLIPVPFISSPHLLRSEEAHCWQDENCCGDNHAFLHGQLLNGGRIRILDILQLVFFVVFFLRIIR